LVEVLGTQRFGSAEMTWHTTDPVLLQGLHHAWCDEGMVLRGMWMKIQPLHCLCSTLIEKHAASPLYEARFERVENVDSATYQRYHRSQTRCFPCDFSVACALAEAGDQSDTRDAGRASDVLRLGEFFDRLYRTESVANKVIGFTD